MTKTQKQTSIDTVAAGGLPTEQPRTKTARLIAMLRAPAGASIKELSDALRWQQHTVRAALTGLRKKGHAITRGKEGSVTTYRIDA